MVSGPATRLGKALPAAIAQVDDLRAEGARIDQFEVDVHAGREVERPATDDDGVDEHPELVDQPTLDARGGELRAADADERVRQRGDLLLEAARRQPRVALHGV